VLTHGVTGSKATTVRVAVQRVRLEHAAMARCPGDRASAIRRKAFRFCRVALQGRRGGNLGHAAASDSVWNRFGGPAATTRDVRDRLDHGEGCSSSQSAGGLSREAPQGAALDELPTGFAVHESGTAIERTMDVSVEAGPCE